MAVTIGRIITARTTPATKIEPPIETLPVANRGNQPRVSLRNWANGVIAGASTSAPHNPKTIEGTAASRSTMLPKIDASRRGA